MQITKTIIRSYLLIVTLLFFALSNGVKSFAQNVGINATGAPPDTSAALDIDITTGGLLIYTSPNYHTEG